MPFDRPASADSRFAIGVDLGGTKIEAIVMAPDGSSRWRERVATPRGDYGATLSAIAGLVGRAEAALGLERCSVGVGIPGTASESGLIKNANSVWLNGQPLARDLHQVLDRPVRIANDADCLALSEATDGAAAGAKTVFAAILGTGVGAGIVVNGDLLAGPNGLAGEWGHNPLPWARADELPGPSCYCGKRGCTETWLSGPAIGRDHRLHAEAPHEPTPFDPAAVDQALFDPAPVDPPVLDARQIAEQADQGDAACIATLRRHEDRTARSLAQVINLLDPHVIVLGGGVSRLGQLVTNVPRLWSRFVFGAGSAAPVRTRLVRSLHGDSSGVRGAAWLWRSA